MAEDAHIDMEDGYVDGGGQPRRLRKTTMSIVEDNC